MTEDSSVIRRVVQHLDLPTEVPEPYPARRPPLPPDSIVVDLEKLSRWVTERLRRQLTPA